MKNPTVAMILALALFAPAIARADASDQGCKSSDNKAKGCPKDDPAPTSMPEPASVVLLASGLAGLVGYSFLRRKQESL